MWLGPILAFVSVIITNTLTAQAESTTAISELQLNESKSSAGLSNTPQLDKRNTSYVVAPTSVSSSDLTTRISATSNSQVEEVSSTKMHGLTSTNKEESSSNVIEVKTSWLAISSSLSSNQEYLTTFTPAASESSYTLIPSTALQPTKSLPSTTDRNLGVTSTTAVRKAEEERSSVLVTPSITVTTVNEAHPKDGKSSSYSKNISSKPRIQLNSTTTTSSIGLKQETGSAVLKPSLVSQTHVISSLPSFSATLIPFHNSVYPSVSQKRSSESELARQLNQTLSLQVGRSKGIANETTSAVSSSVATLDNKTLIRPSVGQSSSQKATTNLAKESQVSHSMVSTKERPTSFGSTTRKTFSTDTVVQFKPPSTRMSAPTTTDSTKAASTPTSMATKLKEQVFQVTMKIKSEEFKKEYDTSIRAVNEKVREIEKQFDLIFETMPEYVYTEFKRLLRNFGCEVDIHTESLETKPVSVEKIQSILNGAKTKERGFGNFVVDNIHVVERDPDVKERQEDEKETWGRLSIIVISILGGVCFVLLVLVISQCVSVYFLLSI